MRVPSSVIFFSGFVFLFALVSSAPEQIHLSISSDPTEMFVTWVISTPTVSEIGEVEKEPDCAVLPPKDPWHVHPDVSSSAHPHRQRSLTHLSSCTQVQFGSDAQSLNMTAWGTAYNYGLPPSWNWTLASATLRNLTADARYAYRVGCEAEGWSAVFAFRTPPATDRPTSIVFLGDVGTSLSGTGPITQDRLNKDETSAQFDLSIVAGDIAYMYMFEPVWDAWFRKLEPFPAYVPLMVAPGNQDSENGFIGYLNRFRMPVAESASPSPFYYSFNFGLVHFVAISSEHSIQPGSQQHVWLESDLAAASQPSQRASQPWIVVYGHRPMYCSNQVWCPDAGNFRSALEPLLIKYGVDVTLWGHVHMYERSWPMINGTATQNNYVNPKAPVHVLAGTGGALLCAYLVTPQPAWSALRSLQFGYLHIQVQSATALRLQFIEQISGAVYDDFVIETDRHGPFAA